MTYQPTTVEEERRMEAALVLQEGRISAPCLKHMPSPVGKGDDDDPDDALTLGEVERGHLFSSTVDAVQTIVREKLYRAKAKSLESYFNSVWHISRAQVYRYLDCATVLDVCPIVSHCQSL